MRFTKAHAEQALKDSGETWESPLVDIIDTLTYAIDAHFSRQGRRVDWDGCIERADALALKYLRR